MKAENKSLLIDVGAVALGGVVNMVAEYAVLTYVSTASVPVYGNFSLNAGDAVGVGSAVAEIVVGKTMKKDSLVLFGAGGLAASLAVLVGKALLAAPLSLSHPSMMGFSQPLTSVRYDIAPAKKGNYR